MRLKNLELKGFKSFAEQTVINFEENVIGIVGPNGSGKSNIVDAIRWVLGEQSSKELRLDQMSSVIFNGAKNKKPSGLAQVTLNFENTKNLLPTEYQQVSISRLLYRSGESEYRLNGVTCRLKDITNLFMDTGVGSNSYAIIALGMVDEILADKDNARRRMFEQAAGISKYKVRKRETLSKLESTSADLERVEDLLFEITNNLKSLEQQARRTKRYFELKEEYKQLSFKLAALKSEVLKSLHKDLQASLRIEEDRYRQIEVDNVQLEAALEAQRKANLDKEKMLSDSQREVNDLIGKIRDMENERKVQEQRSVFIEQNKARIHEQLVASSERMMALESEIANYREAISKEKELESALGAQLKQAESTLTEIRQSHGTLKAGLDSFMNNQQQLERDLFELEKQKAINTNQIEGLQNEILRNEAEVKNRQLETKNLQSKVKELVLQEKAHQARLDQMELEEEQRRIEIAANEEQLDDLKNRIQKIHRELDAKRNEYKLTKSLVENLEGFPESIRFLSNTKNWSKGAPLLSDLIYVEDEFRIAIENFLEPFLNYYVVENLEEAYKAVQLLHSAQKGKANFFILDAFKDYSPPIQMLPGGMQPAFDLVQCEPAYRNLVNYLLENVALTESEDSARQLPNEGMVLLAKSGRFIQRRHSLSGGSIGLFEGKKIGRKKNLELLEQAIRKSEAEEDKLSTKMYNLKATLDRLKSFQSRAEIQLERTALNKIIQEKVSIQARLESFAIYIREVDAKKAVAKEHIKELELSNANIENQLSEKLILVEKAKYQMSDADLSFRQVAEQMSQASAGFNAINIEFIKQQNKTASIERELSFREKQLDELKNSLEHNRRQLEQFANETGAINDELERLQNELEKAYTLRKEKEGSLSEVERNYFQARGGIHEIEDKLRQLNKKSQETQILINNLKDRFNETKYQLSTIAERLRIEFNLQINDAESLSLAPDEKEKLDEIELQMKAERMKNRLDNYGEINPLAVEAYDEMKERHDTITTQRDDILKAKDDLLQTIKEIEETATIHFLDAFSKVRLFFIDVFRSLFTNDDTADLILLDPENPLESNIEIVAKPKGKKPQTISQLSGGEKTLTATALLFALYLLKPAPFCVFDEVDAPLDDANIEKFNRIVNKFSADSQFVIVTHNKQTMAAVDTIYGVFMAEPGVSAVTQVDFRTLAHELVMENFEA